MRSRKSSCLTKKAFYLGQFLVRRKKLNPVTYLSVCKKEVGGVNAEAIMVLNSLRREQTGEKIQTIETRMSERRGKLGESNH